MKLTDQEVLQIISKFLELEDWWDREEGTAFGPVQLVEKTNDSNYDSWSGWSDGAKTMVFKFGEEFFKVEADSSSYDYSIWSSATIKQVKPKTRSVSYYE